MACKRELLFLRKQFLILMASYAVAALVLGGLTWATCHEEYRSSLITTYAGMYPMFIYIIPLSMTFGMRPMNRIGISFGASRRGLFWAMQLLFTLTNVVGIACAAGLNTFLRTMPTAPEFMPFGGAPFTLPACVLWLAALALLVQCSSLVAYLNGNRFVFGIIVGVSAGLFGACYGVIAAMEINPLERLGISFDGLLGSHAFGNGIYWLVLAVLLALTVVAGYFVRKRIDQEVGL